MRCKIKLLPELSAQLENTWNRAAANDKNDYPFAQLAWHQVWRATLGKNDKLLIGISEDGVVLPFRITDSTLSFTGGEEVADYLDLVGPDQKKPEALSEFFRMTAGLFSKLLLRNIPHDSATINFFRENPVWKNKVRISPEDTTPLIDLPDSQEKYLASLKRKYRHELKRKIRRFREQYPEIIFKADQNIGLETEQIFQLMEFNPNKKEFLNPKNREFFQALLKLPYAKTFRLIDGDQTIAFKICLPTKTEYLLYNSGYDPAYEGAGFVLTSEMINYAIENRISKFNFLQGNERYKYDFGAKDFDVLCVETI